MCQNHKFFIGAINVYFVSIFLLLVTLFNVPTAFVSFCQIANSPSVFVFELCTFLILNVLFSLIKFLVFYDEQGFLFAIH